MIVVIFPWRVCPKEGVFEEYIVKKTKGFIFNFDVIMSSKTSYAFLMSFLDPNAQLTTEVAVSVFGDQAGCC